MSKYDVSLVSAVEGRKRQILVDLLRQNSELTLGELHQLSKGELGKLLSSITVQDLLNPEGAAREPAIVAPRAGRPGRPGRKPVAKAPAESRPAKEAAAAPAKAGKGAKAEPAAEVNTRTPTGREAFDNSVFEALKSLGVRPARARSSGVSVAPTCRSVRRSTA
ncbi:hypothetical protein [Nannocystis pusilla]|uniref:hypothetical protein n=1 Tax=Nannocystis pusilla TaxID=889268 RepID=UPI003B82B7B0